MSWGSARGCVVNIGRYEVDRLLVAAYQRTKAKANQNLDIGVLLVFASILQARLHWIAAGSGSAAPHLGNMYLASASHSVALAAFDGTTDGHIRRLIGISCAAVMMSLRLPCSDHFSVPLMRLSVQTECYTRQIWSPIHRVLKSILGHM